MDAELEFTTQNNIELHPEALPCYMRSGQVNQGQWPNAHIWPLEPARHADSGCCVTFTVFWSPYSCSRYDFSPETCTLLHEKMKCKFDLVTWLDLAWIEVKLSCKRWFGYSKHCSAQVSRIQAFELPNYWRILSPIKNEICFTWPDLWRHRWPWGQQKIVFVDKF